MGITASGQGAAAKKAALSTSFFSPQSSEDNFGILMVLACILVGCGTASLTLTLLLPATSLLCASAVDVSVCTGEAGC